MRAPWDGGEGAAKAVAGRGLKNRRHAAATKRIRLRHPNSRSRANSLTPPPHRKLAEIANAVEACADGAFTLNWPTAPSFAADAGPIPGRPRAHDQRIWAGCRCNESLHIREFHARWRELFA